MGIDLEVRNQLLNALWMIHSEHIIQSGNVNGSLYFAGCEFKTITNNDILKVIIMERIIGHGEIQFKKYLETSDDSGAKDLIRTFKNILTNDVGSTTVENVVSKLFDESYNFLKFLQDVYVDSRWRVILKQGLELLDDLYKNYFDAVRTYSSATLELCLKISFADLTAHDRSKAINLIGVILNSSHDIEYKQVESIYNKFFEYAKIKLTSSSASDPKELTFLFINHLRQLTETNANDKTLTSGCFQGLSNIFQEFPLDASDGNTCSKFYEILEKLLKGKQGYDLREGLLFLSHHISIFAKYMYDDSPQKWHKLFLEWIKQDRDNRKAGYRVMEAFYIETAKVLETEILEKDRIILKYFYDYFLKVLENEEASNTEIRLAIRGLAKFAGPCAVHNSKHELSQMLLTVLKYISDAYYAKDEPDIEHLEYLPDYIQCFASILHHIGEHTFDYIDSLQQISVLMIMNFPKISPLYHYSVCASLGTTMFYLYKYNPECLKLYLEIVVYQGILWTCSHRLSFEAQMAKEVTKNIITYKDYLPVWKSLLNPIESSTAMTLQDKQTIARCVYDELMKNLFYLINKLNLNTHRKQGTDFTDPELCCEVEKEPDLKMFINVVDLYVDLLPDNSNTYFKKWLKKYVDQIILKSTQFPLVSGFYKLLKVCLQISEKIQYFDEEELKKEERNKCYKILHRFLEENIMKVQEYKFDLQLSCLELVLSVPSCFVQPLLTIMPTIFQISFTLGRGYLKIAELAVSTLEKWYQNIPVEELKPLLKIVLPYLDPFLRSKGFAGDPDIKIPLLQGRRSRQTKSNRKVYIESESELLLLQKKMLMFVGQLNAETLMYLVENEGTVEQIVWEKQPLLKYTIPFSDVKPSIYFEKLVPRIMELALNSGDQKTRVTACELLHGVVIFMLGSVRQMSPTKQSEMRKLFREVMPCVLQLGCDSNEVVKQLFEPLVLQLVRWYASPIQLMSAETVILIDILMEGISHSTNTATRDLSARSINEFVVWTIKQISKEDVHKDKNIELVLHKICLFCEHPNSFKRLGAALAFNQIYKTLREEESLIDIFWVQLLYSFLINMSFEETKISIDNTIYIDQALNHIERVLKEKSSIFNKNSDTRKYPSVLNTGTLKDIVLWILHQSGTTNPYYRHKCITLFYSLVPYAERNATVKIFVSKHFEQQDWYLQIYEDNGIAQMPKLSSCNISGSVDILKKWLQNLSCCLDAYKFLLENDVIANGEISVNSCVYTALLYFFEYVSSSELEAVVRLFLQYDMDIVHRVHEAEEFCKLKCSVVIDILDFLQILTKKNTDWCRNLCVGPFWDFLSNCVFQPNILGFQSFYHTNIELLGTKITNLFNILYDNLPGHYLDKLCNSLSDYFTNKYQRNQNFKTTFVPLLQRQLLTGILLLSECNIQGKIIDVSDYFTDSTKIVFDSLVTDSKIGNVLPATVREYAELHLKLSFKFCSQIFLVEYLSCKTSITDPEKFSKLSHGKYFLNTFKEIIIQYIQSNLFQIITSLCGKWKTFSDNSSLLTLTIILKYLAESKKFNSDVIPIIMPASSKVFKFSPGMILKDRKFQLRYLTHISRLNYNKNYIIGDNFPFVKSWFIDQLNYDTSEKQAKELLQFKSKVLSLLPCVTGPEDDNYDLLQMFVQNILVIINKNPNVLDHSDLTVLFKKILPFLITSKSRVVLRCLMEIFLNLKDDCKNINIDGVLQLYLTQITVDQQYKSIFLVYSQSFNTTDSYLGRYKLAKIFLTAVLRHCSNETFQKFYIENIDKIGECLTNTASNDIESITRKNISFLVIEVMFARLDLESKTWSTLRGASGGNEPRKLRNELITKAMDILKDNDIQDNTMREHHRLYCCSVFNAVVSMVCNGRKENNIDDQISHLLLNSKYNWKNLIDCSKTIDIPQDFNTLPTRKKVFANIRIKNEQHTGKYIKYIESQTLFKSTLSEDVCKFDFTNNIIRESNDFESNRDYTQYNINIEMIDINDHECMAEFCGMIDFMAKNITEQSALPRWMASIKNILDSSTEKNIRIFFVRVVHNMHHIFKIYAKDFFQSLVKFILDKCAGSFINYFVADLVLMLISWAQNIDMQEFKQFISKLIAFLIENAHNDTRNMLKYNIEIIKTVVEIWRDVIDVPYDILLRKFNKKSPEAIAIINVLGVFLANDIMPFDITNIKHFTSPLLAILQTRFRKPAAEVLGMIFKKLSTNADWKPQLDTLQKSVDIELKSMKNNEHFLHCLEQIQIYYPFIMEKKLNKLYLILDTQIKATELCVNLRNYIRVRDNSSNSLLSAKQFQDLLNNTDQDVRLLALQILNKSASKLNSDILFKIAKTACSFKFDKNSIIRSAVYEFCITVYKNLNNEETFGLCKSVLLSGLLDSDAELQEKIEAFWYNEQYANLSLVDRFLTSVNDLYSPETELYYLGCCNYFLLEGCKSSPEYTKLIFEYPLSDCKFEDVKFMINWRAQNASFRPMFVNTLMTQPNRQITDVPQLVGVRATMSNKAFTPTLDVTLQSSTSLMFDISSKSFSNFLTINEYKTRENVASSTNTYIPYSRRFLKSQDKIKSGFAKRENVKKSAIEEFQRDRVKMKDANIVMYRQYRAGELPDVEIPNSAIIKPLQILTKRDSIIARQFYVMLFDSLLTELDDCTEFVTNFHNAIKKIFDLTYMYVPNMIGAFLDILLACNRKNMNLQLVAEPNALATICKNSGLNPIGCLLLEDYLNRNDEEVSDAKKGCGNKNLYENHWVKLADMYRELNEWDAVTGIFSSEHMGHSDKISKAIQAESNGLWRQAFDEYNDLLQMDFNFDRKDFYYESCFNCHANLSEWQRISDNVVGVSDIWDRNWQQERMVPWLMTAEVMIALENAKRSKILNLLNTWMSDSEKSEYLKDRFPEELSILALLQNNVNTSKHYTTRAFSKFLEEWSNLNPLFTKIRLKKLLNFQKIVDLNAYSTLNDNTEELLTYWERNCDFSTNSIVLSETRSAYRKQMIKTLQEKLTLQNEFDEFEKKLLELNRVININLIRDSINKQNHFVARKYFKKVNYKNKEDITGNLIVAIEACKIAVLSAETQNGEQRIKCLVGAWKYLDQYNDIPINLQIKYGLQLFKTSQNVFNTLKQDPSLFSTHSEDFALLTRKSHTLYNDDICKFSVERLKCAINAGEQSANNSDVANLKEDLMEAYEAFLVFAINEENSNYHSIILKYVLRAMAFGSKVAKQLFPYLLQMPELNTSLLEIFKTEVSSVPKWMFLSWIPQLLASMNSDSIKATYNILIDIAQTYPQALMYVYHLNSELTHTQQNNEFRNKLIEKLNSLLNKDFIDKLLEELSLVCIPEVYVRYHLEKISKLDDITEIKNKVRNLIANLRRKMDKSRHFGVVESYVRNLENAIKDFTDSKNIKSLLKTLLNKVVEEIQKIKKFDSNLKIYSTWLANFRASNKHFELEVPGQYSGNSKPLTNYHVKISSFHPTVNVRPSLRKPIKITMIGNDFKEYPFLIKFGEDLRQDQRIQQLFTIVNDILHNDLQCRQRNLHLETYGVIPLSSNMGLIKWVENTKSFCEFLDGAVADEHKLLEIKNINWKYENWIKSVSKNANSIAEMYANACLKYNKNEVTRMFSEFVYTVPADILSKAFLNISLNLECYASLRQQFIVSYSTMCIVHWLLGIGDRHLENSLVLQKSGKAVGIDFGMAFGAAVQNLSVPDLTPFRLTPHILNLMGPLKEIGLIEYTMIHCLRALRKNKNILLSTLDVFIQDPLIDWLEYAKSSRYESITSPDWIPNQKILCARKKLFGANPRSITENELKSGCLKDIPKFLQAYLDVVAGDPSNIRAKLPTENLTEEEQVKCLLDQATDYNILGRMYSGLQLWM